MGGKKGSSDCCSPHTRTPFLCCRAAARATRVPPCLLSSWRPTLALPCPWESATSGRARTRLRQAPTVPLGCRSGLRGQDRGQRRRAAAAAAAAAVRKGTHASDAILWLSTFQSRRPASPPTHALAGAAAARPQGRAPCHGLLPPSLPGKPLGGVRHAAPRRGQQAAGSSAGAQAAGSTQQRRGAGWQRARSSCNTGRSEGL